MPKRTKIANKREVAAFWTKVMRGELVADAGAKEQLKASEFLSKYHGMFKESKEIPGQIEFVGDEQIAD